MAGVAGAGAGAGAGDEVEGPEDLDGSTLEASPERDD